VFFFSRVNCFLVLRLLLKTSIRVVKQLNIRMGNSERKRTATNNMGQEKLSCANTLIVAELQSAKSASEAPWVRKIGNPSSRENLVMTSAYDRASERTSVQTGGRGRGVSRYFSLSPIWETKECHLSLAVFCLEKSEKHSFLFVMSTNDRGG